MARARTSGYISGIFCSRLEVSLDSQLDTPSVMNYIVNLTLSPKCKIFFTSS